MLCPGGEEQGGSLGIYGCSELYFWAGSFALWEFGEDDVCGLYVVCKGSGGDVFDGE